MKLKVTWRGEGNTAKVLTSLGSYRGAWGRNIKSGLFFSKHSSISIEITCEADRFVFFGLPKGALAWTRERKAEYGTGQYSERALILHEADWVVPQHSKEFPEPHQKSFLSTEPGVRPEYVGCASP